MNKHPEIVPTVPITPQATHQAGLELYSKNPTIMLEIIA
jgi:hypothetical protein